MSEAEKKRFISVYGLVFNNGVRDICFYVGRTEDTARRLKEHSRLYKDPLETTAKYRFMRELVLGGYEYKRHILAGLKQAWSFCTKRVVILQAIAMDNVTDSAVHFEYGM